MNLQGTEFELSTTPRFSVRTHVMLMILLTCQEVQEPAVEKSFDAQVELRSDVPQGGQSQQPEQVYEANVLIRQKHGKGKHSEGHSFQVSEFRSVVVQCNKFPPSLSHIGEVFAQSSDAKLTGSSVPISSDQSAVRDCHQVAALRAAGTWLPGTETEKQENIPLGCC